MLRFAKWLAGLFQLAALMLAALLAAPLAARETNISATLLAEGSAMPGGTVTLAIDMQPAPGWHGYWLNPGDAGQGMTLDWTLPPGAKVGALQYPVPATLTIAGLMNHVYKTEYAVLTSFTVPASAKVGDVLDLRARGRWLACTDEICVPEEGELATKVTVGQPGAADARFDRWRAALPAPLGSPARFAFSGGKLRVAIPLPAALKVASPHLFLSTERVVDYAAPQAFFRQGDLLVAELPVAKFAPEQPDAIAAVLRLNPNGDGVIIAAAPGAVPTGGEPLQVAGDAPATPALGWLLLAALAGGLLLNVMPCVFPILSLKALSLARAGESQAQARAEGLAYTAGVVVACLALGGLLLGLRAAGQEVGWAFQLQEPLVVAALLLLAMAITANLLGLYEFMVPGFASEGSPQGAFATGLLAAFAATPCTGPFMAAAMGAALLLPVGPALLLFGALGLGIALPFLAIAWVPALRRRLPKPGPWMGRFRRWMALPMGLTALALAWLASRIGGNGFAFALALLAVILVAALVLLGRRQRHGLAAGALWWGALAAVLGLSALGLPGMVRAPEASAEARLLDAQPFSEQALARARASGKPVFVYMTADWCLSCKVNERVAIEREPTRDAFARAGVIVLRGDWTRRDPEITRFLTAQGAAGIPLYLWYPAGGGAPQQLPQVLGPESLTELAGN
jgi:DsbC/DsbD-like thiol-disulfide interchange protein/cytochrome c biogenesis protein CcdA